MINYYIFDKIESEGNGCYWGYKDNDFCEVFPLSSNETDEELIEKGFAKCDAPESNQTFIVEESAWESLKKVST